MGEAERELATESREPPQCQCHPRPDLPNRDQRGRRGWRWEKPRGRATESRKPPDAESGQRRQLHATSGSLQGAAAGISASRRNGTRDYESAKMTSRETFVGSFFTSGC